MRFVELIEERGDHLGTGFLSTHLLLPVVAASGHQDVAYRLLTQTTPPSWLYQVEKGATTTWETWKGHKGNGEAFFSHNHYVLGTVAQWLHEGVAGLSQLESGYKRMLVRPYVGGGLTNAAASVDTPFELARSSWVLHEDLREVPFGSQAEVQLGGSSSVQTVGPGTHQLKHQT